MHPTLVILAVGLTARLIGACTPHLRGLAASGGQRNLAALLPAVTCSMQATFTTGLTPRDHGIVGNGWLFRDLMEILFWRQSNRLVGGEPVWEEARRRDPSFTCANLFWWFNMAASHDIGVTPRPRYKADGRKLPDIYTRPSELRDELQAALGTFPLFQFWGPGAAIRSTRWIADATRHVMATRRPTLTLCYLPHLDYDLQRFGPDPAQPEVARALADLDAVVGDLLAAAGDRRILVLSEYGLTPVSRPVAINRRLREAGLLAVRDEDGGELLDPIASRAFAVADHQVAHLYLAADVDRDAVRDLVAALPGVEAVLGPLEKRAAGLDHPNAGDLVAVAQADAWFTYYYWLDDARAPDFARTVEIHRKPGYDPAELFLDPRLRLPKAAIAGRLLRRRLGFRTLMDVIPLDPGLVRGSHGRPTDQAEDGPVLLSSVPRLLGDKETLPATAVKGLILDHLFSDAAPARRCAIREVVAP